MTLKLLLAHSSDAKAVAETIVACSTSARIKLEFGAVRPEDFYAWRFEGAKVELGLSERFNEGLGVEDRGVAIDSVTREQVGEVVCLKMVEEETGKVAAYAMWGLSEKAEKFMEEAYKDIKPPEGVRKDFHEVFSKGLREMTEKITPSGTHCVLLQLVTSPNFQRRGAGRTLVSWGLQKADEMGVPTILNASPDGYLLYKTLGFEELDRIEVALDVYGGSGKHVHVAMIRKPVDGAKSS